MTTLATPTGGPRDPRGLHDLIEASYVALARSSPRWFERRPREALIGGYAGLDSSTMNRVTWLDAPDESSLDRVLREAEEFFGTRRLPWSVHLTPHARPEGAAATLRRRGFRLVSELTVMTRSVLAEPPEAPANVTVREAAPHEIGRFTQLVVEAFRMPARFLAPLTDVNRSWMEAGARGYFALHDDEIVGTALLTRAAGVGTVYNVATLRQARRRGVARALMRRLWDDFDEMSESVLALQAARGSVAERFYARIGFVPRYAWEFYAKDD